MARLTMAQRLRAALIREAVFVERERCAEIAVKLGRDDGSTFVGNKIAEKIREEECNG